MQRLEGPKQPDNKETRLVIASLISSVCLPLTNETRMLKLGMRPVFSTSNLAEMIAHHRARGSWRGSASCGAWLLLSLDARPVTGMLSLLPLSSVRRPAPAPVSRPLHRQRTRLLVAQQGYDQQGYAQAPQGRAQVLPADWSTGVDPASGATYYFHEQTGQSQWVAPDHQQSAQQGARGAQPDPGGAQGVWRLSGSPGVTGFIDKGSHFQQDDYALPYTLRNGDEQAGLG